MPARSYGVIQFALSHAAVCERPTLNAKACMAATCSTSSIA